MSTGCPNKKERDTELQINLKDINLLQMKSCAKMQEKMNRLNFGLCSPLWFRSNLIKSVAILMTALFSACFASSSCSMLSEKVTLYFGIETSDQDPCGLYLVDTYHTDVEVSFTSGGWDILLSHDAPGYPDGIDISPQSGLLYANSKTRNSLATIPAGYDFIGAVPGETFWVLPQNAGNGELPLGIACERSDGSGLCIWNPDDTVGGADYSDRWYKIRLLEVRGPDGGEFSLWQTGGLGELSVLMSTARGGITEDDVFYISDGFHIHMNWGFTKQGLYEVDFQVSTVYSCSGGLSADMWPFGGQDYSGDCSVDLNDFAVIAGKWLRTDCFNDPDPCNGADISEPPNGQVDIGDLLVLAGQWLMCGYPGCDL